MCASVADAENTKEYSFYSVWQNEMFAEYQRFEVPRFLRTAQPDHRLRLVGKSSTLPIEGGVLAYAGLMGARQEYRSKPNQE